jgi:hypothetical protein
MAVIIVVASARTDRMAKADRAACRPSMDCQVPSAVRHSGTIPVPEVQASA